MTTPGFFNSGVNSDVPKYNIITYNSFNNNFMFSDIEPVITPPSQNYNISGDTSIANATVQFAINNTNVIWSVSYVNSFPLVKVPGVSISSSGLLTVNQGTSFLNQVVYLIAQNKIQQIANTNYLAAIALTINITSSPSLSIPLITSGNTINNSFTTQVIQNTTNPGTITWTISLTNNYASSTSSLGNGISINSTGLITIPSNTSFLTNNTVYVFAKNQFQTTPSSISFTLNISGYTAPVLITPLPQIQVNYNSAPAIFNGPTITNQKQCGYLNNKIYWSMNTQNNISTSSNILITSLIPGFSKFIPGSNTSANITINNNGQISVPSGAIINQNIYSWASNTSESQYSQSTFNIKTLQYDTPILQTPGTQTIYLPYGNNSASFISPIVLNSSTCGTLSWSINNTYNYTTATSFTTSSGYTISINPLSGQVYIPAIFTIGTILVNVWATNTDGNYASTNYLLTVGYNSQIMEYPPYALTSTSNIISGQPSTSNIIGGYTYGNGTYIVTQSSYSSSNTGYYAFDKSYIDDINTGNGIGIWLSSPNLYNTTTGIYTGSATTTNITINGVSGQLIQGEWLDILLPAGIILSSYLVQCAKNKYQGPYSWYLVGSSDNGNTWYTLDNQNKVVFNSAGQSFIFYINNSTRYNKYRLIVNGIQQNSYGYVALGEIILYGDPFIEYPPIAITAANQTVTNLIYGNGIYIITGSPNTSIAAYYAFNKNNFTDFWRTYLASYNANGTAITTGSAPPPTTTIVYINNTPTTIYGEWIDILLPNSIILTSYTLQGNNTILYATSPYSWIIAGTNNGSTYYQIDSQSNIVYDNSTKILNQFNVNNNTSYNEYRLIVTNIQNGNNNNGYAVISEWRLFTTPTLPSLLGYGSLDSLSLTSSLNPCGLYSTSLANGTYYGPIMNIRSGLNNQDFYPDTSGNLWNTPYYSSVIQNTSYTWPPAALTTNTTTSLTGKLYGNGTYVATASSSFSINNYAYTAFDKTSGATLNIWANSTAAYSGTTGLYTANTYTTIVNGTTYYGEWLDLLLPNQILLTSYSIQARNDINYTQTPTTWILAGTNNAGTTWTSIDTRSNIVYSQNQIITFNVTTSQYYNEYRLIIQATNNSTYTSINEMIFYGYVPQQNYAWPPAALTTNTTTTLSGQLYGNGAYVATSSSFYAAATNYAYYAFDKISGSTTNIWNAATASYSATTGQYTANTYSTVVNGITYYGEWLDLLLPNQILLTSYIIQARNDTNYLQTPYTWILAGTNNAGTTWTSVDSRSNIAYTQNQTQTFNIFNSQYYNEYRIIILSVQPASNGYAAIGEMILYGYLPTQGPSPITYSSYIGSSTGYVTSWYDQSKRANHAVQYSSTYQPVYNSLIDFSKVNNSYFQLPDGTIPNPYSTNYTVSASYGTISGNSNTIHGVCSSGTYGQTNSILINNITAITAQPSANTYNIITANNSNIITNAYLNPNSTIISSYSTNVQNTYVLYNSAITINSSINLSTVTNYNRSSNYIGYYGSNLQNYYLNGQLINLYLFNNVLTTTDMYLINNKTFNNLSYFTFLFTTMNTSGPNGPAAITYPASSSGISYLSAGIQYFTVPFTGTYQIIAAGASTINWTPYVGGRGIIIKNNVQLTANSVLKILVGQQGTNTTLYTTGSSAYVGYGAGGGTVISTITNTPILVAGGGANAYGSQSSTGGDAVITTTASNGNTGGTGGTAGGGGTNNQPGNDPNAGAGFTGNAAYSGTAGSSGTLVAKSFINGGTGASYGQPYGGFGGGGTIGGGGGYSGGGGINFGGQGFGGGGGSYDINGSANNATIFPSFGNLGYNIGNGFAIITNINTNVLFPLDLLSTSALNSVKGLYSLKRLLTSYTGPIIQLTNSAQTVIQDFYTDTYGQLWTGQNGTGSTVSAWMTTNSLNNTSTYAYVKIWYDQSGKGNNATQTTANIQPRFNPKNATENVLDFGLPNNNAYLQLPLGAVPQNNSPYTISWRHGIIQTGAASTGTVVFAGNGGTNGGGMGIYFAYNGNYSTWGYFDDWNTGIHCDNYNTCTFSWNGTGSGTKTLYLNSINKASATQSGFVGNASGHTYDTIGYDIWQTTKNNSEMYFISMFQSLLTDQDRNIIELQ